MGGEGVTYVFAGTGDMIPRVFFCFFGLKRVSLVS